MEGTRIALLIVEKSREVTSCCSNPASTSRLERVLLAPQAKANHPTISSQYSPQNTNSNSLQNAKFQPPGSHGMGSIYRPQVGP